MNLFIEGFKKYSKYFQKENIKIVFSGRKEPLREDVLKVMDEITNMTKDNTLGTLNVCINYGGRAEIIDATKKILNDNIKDLTETSLRRNISIIRQSPFLFNFPS